MLLIGSHAMLENSIDIGRTPKDYDFVGFPAEVEVMKASLAPERVEESEDGRYVFLFLPDGTIVEIEVATPGSRAEKLLEFASENVWYAWHDIRTILGCACHIPTIDLLLLLKLSHRYKKDSPHFLKTMRDIQLLRKAGAKLLSHWYSYLKDRENDTYLYKHPKLNVEKGEFFDMKKTGVHQKYDHDSLHEVVALNEFPAYTAYLKPGQDVECDRTLFEALPHEVKLAGVIEEAMVLALERSLIHFNGRASPNRMFYFALQKVCTSITSGWFREFAWEHYDEACAEFRQLQKQKCYYDIFLEAEAKGKVRLNPANV